MDNTQPEMYRFPAAGILGNIAPGHKTAIAALLELIDNSQSEYIRKQAAENLSKIDPGYKTKM